ncbi:NACHT, LRR and PYD domains-containing protein 4 [Ochotona curzoniae]|uniref:NACHT, LRR and PYD domains-containing protein 4 n=1 Tax=Ochotona curzoniae TaxID=130825 RepID=UPI001B347195|nr:NACHT, LRR and PYD domains-containing protein 4 [Ochotona curzoniae]
MAASFFSDFGLLWYLEELKRKEFVQFKEHLKRETLQQGLEPIPWAKVKKASRADLADLMTKSYKQQRAWEVTLAVFHRLGRKDLCDRARSESTGHAKLYQDHVRKTFHAWEPRVAAREACDLRLSQEEREFMCRLFAPGDAGEQAPTVVFQASPGMGKTTLLWKLLLAWAEGSLYQDRFACVFYLCCHKLKPLAPTSLAGLLACDWPDAPASVAEILTLPERLLFLVDSLEELGCDLLEPESPLCSSRAEMQPVWVLLNSLLGKTLLPGASLLVAATPECARKLATRLQNPKIITLRGFSENHRKLYFCSWFQSNSRALEAFRCVRENPYIFSMCRNPQLCWLACVSVKQEMDRGRDPALSCRCVTSLFVCFILNSFTPKGARGPPRQSRALLKGLCSLAAEGIWTNASTFSREALRRNGLTDSDVAALLDARVLRRRAPEDSYALLHLGVQEFCAALFHLLQRGDHPHPAVRDVETLLQRLLSKSESPWIFLGCFVFGLLNEREQERLDAFFGSHRSQERKQQLLGLLKSLDEEQVDFALLFSCLCEIRDEAFVRQTMESFREIKVTIAHTFQLAASAYCLGHCSGLRKLCLSVQNVFPGEDGGGQRSQQNLVLWRQICTVLTTNQHLYAFQVRDSSLPMSVMVDLCHQLKQPKCYLQKLQMNNVSLRCEMWAFFEVLIHNPNVTCLDLSCTGLSQHDVQVLSKALKHPACNVRELLANVPSHAATAMLMPKKNRNAVYELLFKEGPARVKAMQSPESRGHVWEQFAWRHCYRHLTNEGIQLASCRLGGPCCPVLSEVLQCSSKLTHLDLSINVLQDEGLRVLCAALGCPSCHLQSLWLFYCGITAAGCEELASALPSCQGLKNLQVGGNSLGDASMKPLCEALAHPSCHLEILGLQLCGLTSACCLALSSALTSSKTLRSLDLSENALDLSGLVVLVSALRQPTCALEVLG